MTEAVVDICGLCKSYRSGEGTIRALTDISLDFIYPSLSAETRTARVRIVLPNADGALRAAMYADVQIDASAGETPVLSVPNSAVLDSGTRQVVLVARGEGCFEPRAVRLGVQRR
jgi:Cu(I)/Ag(I) efflux system membrane fusion protein